MQFEDTLNLRFSHNLILGNMIKDKMSFEEIAIKMQKDESTVERYGLFDSNTANYNTYYPNVSAEDLNPQESEFINPTFRALSEVIVHKGVNPVDFGEGGVLKKSMTLLDGATINADHETSIGNAMGAVNGVAWQESYKNDKGIFIPAGINANLKIDGKSHPRVARAIMMSPPAIHSTSVTVQFNWDKSHPSLSEQDFFTQLGKVDKDGKMVRRIATHVKRYHEISLVSHGADPYAQLIKETGKDGKDINNAKWADVSYNSLSGVEKSKQKTFFFDYKTDVIANTIPEESNNNNLEHQTETIMNKDQLISLAAVLGIKIADVEAISAAEITQIQTTASALITNAATASASLLEKDTEITRLKAIETTYLTDKATFAEAVQLKAFQESQTTSLRATVKALYNVVAGATPNATLVKLIDEGNFETLSALNIQYSKDADEKMPLSCKKCGSTEVNRASAQVKNAADETREHSEDSVRNSIKAREQKKNKGLSIFAGDADTK